jgi:hypothetical protein
MSCDEKSDSGNQASSEARRRSLLQQALKIQRMSSGGDGSFLSAEEMQRADRCR